MADSAPIAASGSSPNTDRIVHVKTVVPCPEAPTIAATATHVASCSALEVNGTVAANRVTVEPAFDLLLPPEKLSQPNATGNAALEAYDGSNQLVFRFPFNARGEYRIDVPLAASVEQSIRRLRVINGSAYADRTASLHGDVSAETFPRYDHSVVLAWNALAFPAIRIATIAIDHNEDASYASGTESFQQIRLETTSPRLIIDFSDGVRSTRRIFTVFGR